MAAGRFLPPLIAQHTSAGRKQHYPGLRYRGANGTIYTVPAGVFSDGASVPRPLWSLYPPFGGAYEPAAWLHDYLYAYAEQEYGTDHGHVSRAEADGLLDEAMESLQFRRTGRWVIYRSVRLGGWAAWHRYRLSAATRLLAR